MRATMRARRMESVREGSGLRVAGADSGAQHESSAAAFERLLKRVSAILADAPWQHVGAEVDRMLGELLGFCAVDQVGLIQVLPDRSAAYLRHAACSTATSFPPQRFSYGDRFPTIFQKTVGSGEVVSIAQPDELPADADMDRDSMRALGAGALVHIPLRLEGEVRFVLMAGRTNPATLWSEECISRLEAFGELFALAITRAETLGVIVANRHDVHDAFQAAHLGRWEWDIGAEKLYLSEEAKHILGADVPSLTCLVDLVHPFDRARVERSIKDACAQAGTRFKTTFAVRTPAGETRDIQQWHEAMFPGSRTGRLVATVLDVTALRKIEQEMVQLREHQWHSVRVAQTTLLVASLAHELSQPLSAILNNAQAGLRFLHNGDLCPDDMRDILSDIVASNKRASEVLTALRSMLRRQSTTRITFDAADAVNDVIALVRSELMTQLIEVETALAPGCHLTADKTQIEQVLLNLVMNSIDAMRGLSDGERLLQIELSATESGEVQIAVADSGRGIPGDQFAKVFEAFWTTKRKGLGIGLPVCRAIVESYGGRIWCENNTVGGVTFRLTLPSAELQR